MQTSKVHSDTAEIRDAEHLIYKVTTRIHCLFQLPKEP